MHAAGVRTPPPACSVKLRNWNPVLFLKRRALAAAAIVNNRNQQMLQQCEKSSSAIAMQRGGALHLSSLWLEG